ncbi:cytochrome P450 [Lactarius hengduanensis]|nr:cytochrome P450 [Lactarius hengduanensis]
MEIVDFTWSLVRISYRATYLLAVTFLTGSVLWLITRLASASATLPPGPRGLPLIGDVVHITDQDWLTAPQRMVDYGEMMYINALGIGVLVVNSQRVAANFWTQNLTLSFSLFGDLWHRHRRVAVEGFSKSNSHKSVLSRVVKQSCWRLSLSRAPVSPETTFQTTRSSIMLSHHLRLPPTESEDDRLSWNHDHVERLLFEVQAGTRRVEVGGKYGLRNASRAWIVGKHVVRSPTYAADATAAGQETTSTTLHWVLLAMIVNPAVPSQGPTPSSTRVVGRARPPTFADVPSLPYIRAMLKETLRWSPITVLGMPHSSIRRRLVSRRREGSGQRQAGREDGPVTFGMGWRVCPGRYVAEDSLVIDLATVLWAMRFERPDGARGELDTHTVVHSA